MDKIFSKFVKLSSNFQQDLIDKLVILAENLDNLLTIGLNLISL